MSKYLLYNPLKFKTKIFIFGRVIEISLGDYFLFAHSVYMYHACVEKLSDGLRQILSNHLGIVAKPMRLMNLNYRAQVRPS